MRGVFKKPAAHLDVENISKVVMWSGGFFGLWTYAKNTLLLKFYRKLVVLKGEDGPVEPSLKLSNLVNEVIEELKDRASEYTDIEPVIVPGVKLFNMGTWGTFSGGFLGLPAYFECTSVDEISKIVEVRSKTQGKETSETKVESEDIYNLFLLSEEAKKYAIAREVLLINNLQVYVNTFLPFAASCLVTAAINYPAVVHGLSVLPSQTRILFFFSTTVCCMLLWRKAHSFVKRYYEKEAGEDISSLGESYLRGALEYNSKEMKRRAYRVEMKGQNDRILNKVREKIEVLVPKGLSPAQKYMYFKNILENNSTVNS